jgi:tRNA A37 threonylcarbamoyladenosine dehydratase
MNQSFERQSMIIGEDATRTLAAKKVAIFGLGGVGSYVAEALARCGIGELTLCDSDTVSRTNINRQLCALESTVGRAKVDVVAERISDINPQACVIKRQEFFLPENADGFDFSQYDYVVDAIDTVSAKVELAVRCTALGVPLISCMGTGNKLDPLALRLTDLSKTSGCPLARVMRRELKARGITHLRVVFSEEPPIKPSTPEGQRPVPGSIAFVPSVAGLLAASEVVKYLIS